MRRMSPSRIFDATVVRGGLEHRLAVAGDDCLRWMELREVLADDLVAQVSLDTFRLARSMSRPRARVRTFDRRPWPRRSVFFPCSTRRRRRSRATRRVFSRSSGTSRATPSTSHQPAARRGRRDAHALHPSIGFAGGLSRRAAVGQPSQRRSSDGAQCFKTSSSTASGVQGLTTIASTPASLAEARYLASP